MGADLAELKILPREIARLSGLEVSAHFIGGLMGGAYRRPLRRSLGGWFTVGSMEIAYGWGTPPTRYIG